MAKMVNFGLAYGMSDFGLSSRAGISRQEAQEFINSLLRGLLRDQLLHAPHQGDRAPGRASSRRCWVGERQIPELHAANPALRGAGERMAINMPIQGTAADIVKIAMIRLDRAADGRAASRPGCSSRSTTSSCSRSRATRSIALVPILREVMESALPLDVPLTVDVKVGDDWESMTPVSRTDAVLAEAGEAPGI